MAPPGTTHSAGPRAVNPTFTRLDDEVRRRNNLGETSTGPDASPSTRPAGRRVSSMTRAISTTGVCCPRPAVPPSRGGRRSNGATHLTALNNTMQASIDKLLLDVDSGAQPREVLARRLDRQQLARMLPPPRPAVLDPAQIEAQKALRLGGAALRWGGEARARRAGARPGGRPRQGSAAADA